jgi:poly(3-hydroxybutyrate) depolymerase
MRTKTILIVLLLATASSLSAALTKTTTTLSSSLNPSVYGQAVTFTAVVAPAPPDGETITFLQGKTTLGTGTLSGGTATYTTSTLAAGGTDSIKAEYAGDGTYESSTSNVVSQVVEAAPTSTSLSSSPNPSNYGQSVTFTASVVAQSGGTVSGNVAFYNGSTKIAEETLSGGVTSYSTTKLPGGSDSMTAVYKGSTSFLTSTSAVLTQVVNGGGGGTATITTLSSSQNPSVFGQPVTFTAVVAPAPPNGETVTFLQGKNPLGTGTLSSGTATYTTSTLAAGGTDTIKAEYPGDGTYDSSTSNAVKQVVDAAPTSTTLSSSPNPSNYGQSVTFKASVVAQSGGTVSGNVAFYNGSTKIGEETLSGGVTTYSTTKLPGGSDSITAVYKGSNSFATSTSAILIQTVNGGGGGGKVTATTLSSSQDPSVFEQPVTFTAIVAPAPPNGETVTFLQGKNPLGTGTLSGGTATYTSSTLDAGGTDTIKAEYPGDGTYDSSTSNAVKQVVDAAPTSTTLVSSQNPSQLGQSVTFTATVTPTEYSGMPTGNVFFYNGSAKLGAVTLAGGVAGYTTTKLPVGTDSITAVYSGSSSFLSSTSSVLSQTVNPGPSGCGSGTFVDSSMVVDGITRYYEVYVPANLPGSPVPLLLMLHGTQTTKSTGADPEPIISMNWGWVPVADQNCFVLVKPASTYDTSTYQWNWNAYCMDGGQDCAPYGSNGGAFPYAEGCDSADGQCPDDSGFLRQLIIGLTSEYNVDPNRVYVAGFSSGAEMAERVGFESSDLVAAIVPASGQLVAVQGVVPPPLPLPLAPVYPISVQEWHGTLDENLPPCNYGTTKYNGVTFTLDTVDDTFNFWTAPPNACTTFATTQPLCLNGAPNNLNDAPMLGIAGLTGNDATACADNVEVEFIWEPNIEHSWQQEYDAQRWAFFQAHPCQHNCGSDAKRK